MNIHSYIELERDSYGLGDLMSFSVRTYNYGGVPADNVNVSIYVNDTLVHSGFRESLEYGVNWYNYVNDYYLPAAGES